MKTSVRFSASWDLDRVISHVEHDSNRPGPQKPRTGGTADVRSHCDAGGAPVQSEFGHSWIAAGWVLLVCMMALEQQQACC